MNVSLTVPSKKAGFLDGVQTATGFFGVQKEQYAKEGSLASTAGSLAGTLGTNVALQGGLSALNNTVVPKKFRAATSVIAGVTTAGLTAFSEYQRANADGKVTDAERGNIIAQSVINGGSVMASMVLGSKIPGKGKLAAIGIGALDTGMGAGFSVVGNGFVNMAQGKRFEENAGQSALMGAGGTFVGYGIGRTLTNKKTTVQAPFNKKLPQANYVFTGVGLITSRDKALQTNSLVSCAGLYIDLPSIDKHGLIHLDGCYGINATAKAINDHPLMKGADFSEAKFYYIPGEMNFARQTDPGGVSYASVQQIVTLLGGKPQSLRGVITNLEKRPQWLDKLLEKMTTITPQENRKILEKLGLKEPLCLTGNQIIAVNGNLYTPTKAQSKTSNTVPLNSPENLDIFQTQRILPEDQVGPSPYQYQEN